MYPLLMAEVIEHYSLTYDLLLLVLLLVVLGTAAALGLCTANLLSEPYCKKLFTSSLPTIGVAQSAKNAIALCWD